MDQEVLRYIGIGKNGTLQSFGRAKDTKRAPELRVRLQKRPTLMEPFVEVEEHVENHIKEWHAALGTTHYGPFRDEMHFIRMGDLWIAIEYGAQAFPAPALAADIVPFFLCADGLVFLGIIRGMDPGKGRPGLIGGFREVYGTHFDTPLQCLLKESHEEAGFRMTPLFPEDVWEVDQESAPATVHIGMYTIPTYLYRVGDFHTSSEEESFGGEEKRVHQTTAYTCRVGIPMLSSSKVFEQLKAGDDASALVLQPTDTPPDFGIAHHAIIYGAAFNMISLR